MSIVQNPIIGRSSQSAGGMTFTTNLRKNVMRSKAFQVTNPKTDRQTAVRRAFKLSTSFSSQVTRVIAKYGISAEASRKKIYASNLVTRAMRATYDVDFTGAAFGELSSSFGENKEVTVAVLTVKVNPAGKLQIAWSNANRASKGLPSVNVCLLLKKEDTDEGEAIEPTEMTEDEYYESLEAQTKFAVGDKVHVWICAYNASTKRASLFNDNGVALHTITAGV